MTQTENPLNEADANKLIAAFMALCTKYGCGPDEPVLPWLDRRLKFAQIVGIDDGDEAEGDAS